MNTACNRHSNETVSVRKHATKHSNMRKLMSYFPENVRIMALKSLDLTWFLSPNLSIYFHFVRCWLPLWYNHIVGDFPCIVDSVCVQYLYYVLFTQNGALVNLENGVQLFLTLNEHNYFIHLIYLKHFSHERIVIFSYLMSILLK